MYGHLWVRWYCVSQSRTFCSVHACVSTAYPVTYLAIMVALSVPQRGQCEAQAVMWMWWLCNCVCVCVCTCVHVHSLRQSQSQLAESEMDSKLRSSVRSAASNAERELSVLKALIASSTAGAVTPGDSDADRYLRALLADSSPPQHRRVIPYDLDAAGHSDGTAAAAEPAPSVRSRDEPGDGVNHPHYGAAVGRGRVVSGSVALAWATASDRHPAAASTPPHSGHARSGQSSVTPLSPAAQSLQSASAALSQYTSQEHQHTTPSKVRSGGGNVGTERPAVEPQRRDVGTATGPAHRTYVTRGTSAPLSLSGDDDDDPRAYSGRDSASYQLNSGDDSGGERGDDEEGDGVGVGDDSVYSEPSAESSDDSSVVATWTALSADVDSDDDNGGGVLNFHATAAARPPPAGAAAQRREHPVVGVPRGMGAVAGPLHPTAHAGSSGSAGAAVGASGGTASVVEGAVGVVVVPVPSHAPPPPPLAAAVQQKGEQAGALPPAPSDPAVRRTRASSGGSSGGGGGSGRGGGSSGGAAGGVAGGGSDGGGDSVPELQSTGTPAPRRLSTGRAPVTVPPFASAAQSGSDGSDVHEQLAACRRDLAARTRERDDTATALTAVTDAANAAAADAAALRHQLVEAQATAKAAQAAEAALTAAMSLQVQSLTRAAEERWAKEVDAVQAASSRELTTLRSALSEAVERGRADRDAAAGLAEQVDTWKRRAAESDDQLATAKRQGKAVVWCGVVWCAIHQGFCYRGSDYACACNGACL